MLSDIHYNRVSMKQAQLMAGGGFGGGGGRCGGLGGGGFGFS